MAASQKRLLSAPTSILGKVNLVQILRKPESWMLLPLEVQQQLYALLPAPTSEVEVHDPDRHPLHTSYKSYIEEELRRFQEDLRAGREQKKWRERAIQAGKDRREGKFDEWNEVLKEERSGPAATSNQNRDASFAEPKQNGAKTIGSATADEPEVLSAKDLHGNGDEMNLRASEDEVELQNDEVVAKNKIIENLDTIDGTRQP